MLSKLLPDTFHLPLRDGGYTWQHKMAVVTGGIVGAAVIWYLWKRYDNRNLPPGPTGWPIVGCKHLMEGDNFESTMTELGKKYGDVFSVQNGSTLCVVLNSYSAIKEAFVEQADIFSFRNNGGLMVILNFKDDIFSTPYQSPGWTENKALLLSCLRSAGFGPSKELEDKLSEQIQLLLDHLDNISEQNVPLDLGDILPKTTVNVIFQIIMGRKYEYDDPGFDDVMRIVRNFNKALLDALPLDSLPAFLLKTIYRSKVKSLIKVVDELQALVRAEINDHMATLDPDNPRDFIDLYLTKTGGKHSLPRMVDNILIFLPDASESMVLLLSMVFLYVIYYPDVQKKMADEIIGLTGGNRCVTWADRVKLPYTDAVILEVLRMEQPFPFLAPHAVCREVLFRGYRIPTKAAIFAHVRNAQRDPTLFPDPEKFKPERFIKSDGSATKTDTWMPFGIGRRKCIGEQISRMEIFMITANLVQRYHMTFPEGHVPTLEFTRGFASVPPPYTVVLNKRD